MRAFGNGKGFSLRAAKLIVLAIVCAHYVVGAPKKCTTEESTKVIMLPSVTKVDCCDPEVAELKDGVCCINYYEELHLCVCTKDTVCDAKSVKPETKLTTTPATTPATTEPQRKVCTSFKLLNGQNTSTCDFPGAVSIRVDVGNDLFLTLCNGAFVSPLTQGKTQVAFFTTSGCKSAVDVILKQQGKITIEIGNQTRIPLTDQLFEEVLGDNGDSVFYKIKPLFESLLTYSDPCRQPACTLSKSMEGQVDMSKCELVSYGSAFADTLAYAGWQKRSVAYTSNTFCDAPPAPLNQKNTMCFKATDDNNLYCNGDAGALLYCESKAKEKVLVGLAVTQFACDKSKYVRIVPYPSDMPSRELKTTTTPDPVAA